MKALTATNYNFPGQQAVYHGKVRDVYNINGEKLVMVATDRISAQGTDIEPDCREVPRCHDGHLPQLEAGHARPDGDRRRLL